MKYSLLLAFGAVGCRRELQSGDPYISYISPALAGCERIETWELPGSEAHDSYVLTLSATYDERGRQVRSSSTTASSDSSSSHDTRHTWDRACITRSETEDDNSFFYASTFVTDYTCDKHDNPIAGQHSSTRFSRQPDGTLELDRTDEWTSTWTNRYDRDQLLRVIEADDRDPDSGHTRIYRWEEDQFVGVRIELPVLDSQEDSLGALAEDGVLWEEVAYERNNGQLIESRHWSEDPEQGVTRTRHLWNHETSLGFDTYTSYDGGEETLTYSVRYEYDGELFPVRARHESADGTVTVHEIQITCE